MIAKVLLYYLKKSIWRSQELEKRLKKVFCRQIKGGGGDLLIFRITIPGTLPVVTFANFDTVYTVINISKAAAPQMCLGNRNVLGTLSKVYNPRWLHRGIGFLQMERPFTRGLRARAPAVSGSHDIWSVGMTRVWQRPGRHGLHSHRVPHSDARERVYRKGFDQRARRPVSS